MTLNQLIEKQVSEYAEKFGLCSHGKKKCQCVEEITFLRKALREAITEYEFNNTQEFVGKTLQQVIREAKLAMLEEDNKIFNWLLGEEEFPERKEDEGAYWWRNELREKLSARSQILDKLSTLKENI